MSPLSPKRNEGPKGRRWNIPYGVAGVAGIAKYATLRYSPKLLLIKSNNHTIELYMPPVFFNRKLNEQIRPSGDLKLFTAFEKHNFLNK
jgi:hypothetical protein